MNKSVKIIGSAKRMVFKETIPFIAEIRIYKLFLILCLGLLFGCTNVKEQSDLGEIEMYFDEPLSSVNGEADSIHWIGSEYGNVWRITNQGQQKYKIASNRIYFVKKIADSYAISVRNGGLRFYELHQGGMTLRQKVSMPEKGELYSTYDILPVQGGLLMGTSQGLFLYEQKGETLKKLYPSRQSNRNTFQVTRLIELPGKQKIVAATENGLLFWDRSTGKTELRHQGEKIGDIAIYHHQLMVVAEKQCYVLDNNRKEKSYELPDAMHFFLKTGNTIVFLGMNHAYLTEDLIHFTHIALRRPIPQKASYVVSAIPGDDFLWMVTDHAIWKIPSHLAGSGADRPVMASCKDQGKIYFVDVQNNIYVLDRGGSKATKVFDFIKSSPIVSCAACQGKFYYLDNQRMVYQLSLGSHLWENYLTTFQNGLFSSQSKVTALHINVYNESPQLMIGMQDGLMLMSDGQSMDSLKEMRNKYVTSIFQKDGDSHIYISTLNDGLVILQNHHITKINSDSGISPQQVVVTSSFPSDMVVATNDRVFLQGSKDTLMLAGTGKLLIANDSTIYAVLDGGIEKLGIRQHHLYDKGRFFSDIHFNPQACQSVDGKLFLGCNLGIMTFNAGLEKQSHWMPMTESIVTRRELLALFVLAIFLIAALWGIRYFIYHWSRGELRTRKSELTHRIHDIWPYRKLFEKDLQIRLESMREQVYEIHYTGLGSWKRVDAQISDCSDAIMRMNRDVVLSLLRLLQTQISEITASELFDAPQLVKDTETAVHNGRPDQLAHQAMVNRQWLEEVSASKKQLLSIQENLKGTLPLKNITDQLPEMIDQYQKNLAILPLKDAEPLFNQIRESFSLLTTAQVNDRLQQYCLHQIQAIQGFSIQDKVNATLCSQYQEALRRLPEERDSGIPLTECLEILRRLQHLDDRCQQLMILQQVREKMDTYACEIEEESETHATVQAIHQLSENFYRHLAKTDPRLLNDILQFNSSDSQPARVLLLLMAQPKVKRLLIPGMLDLAGNLNPVISRLVKGRLKPQEETLRGYAERHPSSVAEYILVLTQKR